MKNRVLTNVAGGNNWMDTPLFLGIYLQVYSGDIKPKLADKSFGEQETKRRSSAFAAFKMLLRYRNVPFSVPVREQPPPHDPKRSNWCTLETPITADHIRHRLRELGCTAIDHPSIEPEMKLIHGKSEKVIDKLGEHLGIVSVQGHGVVHLHITVTREKLLTIGIDESPMPKRRTRPKSERSVKGDGKDEFRIVLPRLDAAYVR